jgi:ubiquinone/menaquinone biosynthesis C-methylase UbiE
MEFTGERAIDGKTPDRIWHDHIERYRFAADYTKDKTVLDIASGTGYGVDLFASNGAIKAVGIDVDPESIGYARVKYKSKNAEYLVGNINKINFSDRYFDVITCFETIEHVEDHTQALKELKRVLKPSGILIISSPNRRLTSPGKALDEKPNNRYHIKEFNQDEFCSILQPDYTVNGLYGQRRVHKLLLTKFPGSVLIKIMPFLYASTSGKPNLEVANRDYEYRYITAVCVRK